MNKPLKNTIGLDIRNSALTAVELAMSKKGLKVVNFARVELEPNIVEDNCIVVNPEAFKEALSRLLQEGYAGSMSVKNVIISMPEEKTFTHNICIPHDKIEDSEFVADSAKDFIPIELSEATTDFRLLSTCDSKKEVKYNFVAVQKSIIESLIEILGEVGLKVVFVDVDKNSLIRACSNHFHQTDGDFMIVNIDEKLTTFSINNNTTGISYALDSEIAGEHLIEAVKEGAKIPTLSDTKKILNELYNNPELEKDDKYTVMGSALKAPLENLIKDIKELADIAANQDSVKVKTIYLIGSHSRIPGLSEVLKEAFPNSNIIPKFQYIQLNEDTELYYCEAIGLALRSILPEEDEHEINLLPSRKKEELFNKMLVPTVRRVLLGITVSLAILLVLSGMVMGKSYIGLQVSDKEVEISNEKAQNPYLHRAAQDIQQKTQLTSQLGAILSDALPGGYFMQKMDKYNEDGIELVSVGYKINSNSTNSVRVRAKTEARYETEKFIEKLENDTHLVDIISPLSNLTGKGERFINIDLTVVMDILMADFNKKYGLVEDEVAEVEEGEAVEETAKPKRPSIKVPAETIDEIVEETIEETAEDDTATEPETETTESEVAETETPEAIESETTEVEVPEAEPVESETEEVTVDTEESPEANS